MSTKPCSNDPGWATSEQFLLGLPTGQGVRTKLAHAEERVNPIFDDSFRSHVCPWPSSNTLEQDMFKESIEQVWWIEFGTYPYLPLVDYTDLRGFGLFGCSPTWCSE